jgi:hypothetical protein
MFYLPDTPVCYSYPMYYWLSYALVYAIWNRSLKIYIDFFLIFEGFTFSESLFYASFPKFIAEKIKNLIKYLNKYLYLYSINNLFYESSKLFRVQVKSETVSR